MKIEPLGVERDRQIAELRDGNKWDTCSQVKEGLCLPWASDTDPCDECHRTPYKPYSTDISAAMELLDGMRYEYAEIEITHLRTDEQWLIRPFKEDGDVMHDNFEFEVREPTLQGAISGAWLRHKGGDNG